MSELVDPGQIESIVGIRRHAVDHFARAISKIGVVYLLHSERCLETTLDLRDCEHSLALDAGIDPGEWAQFQDQPVRVVTYERAAPHNTRYWLVPVGMPGGVPDHADAALLDGL